MRLAGDGSERHVESVLSQVYLLSISERHLSVLDDAQQNTVPRMLTGLGRDARVFSEWASC